MNRIRLLPEQVANQIAAGEVIERPASVVKELVENALDAEASEVRVEIQAGGRSLIRVTDDGVGMSRDDALLCLERHATSKIKKAEDLAAVLTMGFRGEALPSIASVSRFTLTTREHGSDSPEATQVVLSGGKIQEVKAAGRATGTTVEVRQLFFNLPARRKFLRTEETESAHIQHYLVLAALAFSEVGFTFLKDGRQVWQLAAIPSGTEVAERLAALRERLRALYGDERKLLRVNFSAHLEGLSEAESPETISFDSASPVPTAPTQEANIRVWGFIGAPGVSRATREDQHVFVNRRPVENRGLNYALMEGYHTSLMKGRYPVCCLFLEMDPAAVDVNIHPAKREVKFHREAEVRRLVAQAVRQTLLEFHAPRTGTTTLTGDLQPAPEAATQETTIPNSGGTPTSQHSLPSSPVGLKAAVTNRNDEGIGTPRTTSLPAASLRAEQRSLPMGFGRKQKLAANGGIEPPDVPGVEARKHSPDGTGTDGSRPPEHSMGTSRTGSLPQPTTGVVPLLNVPLRLVGVIGRLYVVLESDRGLVLLDQHAAHERILFEEMLTRLEKNDQAPSQKLLLPATLELSARDANFVREQLPVLARLGVGLSEFGERTFLLDALPPFVKASDPRRFVLQMIDELKAAGQEVNTLRLGEQMVAKTVCRHAVKANDPLAGPELEKLIQNLRQCAMPYTCPHGRPTLIEMNFRELEKKFGRTA